MTKLKNLTQKQLRAFIAILVAVAVVVPGLMVFVVKGASSADGTKLDTVATKTAETNDAITYTVKDGGMKSDIYNITYNGRTYVYDLAFSGEDSVLDETRKLIKGDTLIFNKESKDLSWTYDPAHRGGTNVTANLAYANAEGDTVYLNDKKALISGTTYYYKDPGTNHYFFFSIKDDYIGYKGGSTKTIADIETSGANPNYQYQRVLTDPEMIDSADHPIALVIDRENNTLTLQGDQLKRRQIYVKTNTLTNGGIYLIRKNDGQLMKATTINSTRYQDGGSSYSDCNYNRSSSPHSYYNLTEETDPSVAEYTYGDNLFYDENGHAYTQLASYYDGGDEENALSLSEFRAKDKSHRVYYNKGVVSSDQITISGYYLFGYHPTSENTRKGCYSSDKTLGKIFYGTETMVTLFDLCEGTSRQDYREYNHNDNAIWNYNSSAMKLFTRYRGDSNHDSTVQTGYLQRNESNNYSIETSTNDQFSLYKRQSVYTASLLSNENLASWESDKLVTGSAPPSSITYTETEGTDDGLELTKTVKANSSADTFDVTLEAHMSKQNIVRPDTDVEIVLDTSLAMGNKVYSSYYKNLKTYSKIEGVSTANLTHDNLYDDDYHDSGFIGWVTQRFSGIWQWLTQNRKFIHNKYVEDPNFPGTYVYLHQEYYSDGPNVSVSRIYLNYYKYYFTSANGEQYCTYDFTNNSGTYSGYFEETIYTTMAAAPTAGDIIQTFGVQPNYLTSGLTFYKESDLSRPNVNPDQLEKYNIQTIYHVPDYVNTNNDEKSLNKNIWVNRNNLYTKINGKYKKVTLTESGGMYTYSVIDDDDNNKLYTFTTGGKKKLQNSTQDYSGIYGIFQGFRHYTYDKTTGEYKLDPTQNNLLSKTLYVKENVKHNVTGLTATQEAIEDFLLKAHEQAVSKDATIHVGLVNYDKDAYNIYTLKTIDMKKPVGTNTVDTMISEIYNIDLEDETDKKHGHNTWAAELGKGMDKAYEQMQTSNAGSKRYTMVFSGGKPIEYRYNWGVKSITDWTIVQKDKTERTDAFSMEIASHALEKADDFKNSLNTTVYTVGTYDNASNEWLHGRAWYYRVSDTWPCNGLPGSHAYWGGSWLSNLTGYTIDPTDAYATNRMLAYMSSDYANGRTLGIEQGKYAPGTSSSWVEYIAKQLTKASGYRITNKHSKTDTGHFFGISPNTLGESPDEDGTPEELTESAFDTAMNAIIANLQKATEVAKTNLDTNAILVDGITPYFDLINPETGITAYSTTPSDVEENRIAIPSENIHFDSSTKTVSVKGFDYSGCYYDENSPGPNARKLVVKFQIKRDGDFLGGNFVPTNQSKSGVYDGQGSEPGVLVERFDIPHVDLSLKQITDYSQNDSVYYSYHENLADLVNPSYVDGYKNSYVDIEYIIKDKETGKENTYTILHGETTGSWDKVIGANDVNMDLIYPQMFDTTDYSVKVNVTPVYDGTYDDNDDGNPEETATVYVFKPHYELKDGVVDEYATETNRSKIDLTSIPDLSWKVFDSEGAEITDGKTAIEALLPEDDDGNKIDPQISYGLTNQTESERSTVNDAEKTNYKINLKTTFKVEPVSIVPAPFSYSSYEDVTHYYNADGDEVDKATYDQISGAKPDPVTQKEWVDKIKTYQTEDTVNPVNATEATSFYNKDHEDWTDGRFLVKAKGHDVTVSNVTQKNPNDADFADKSHYFPMKFTLTTDGTEPFAQQTISYVDANGNTQSITTNDNGEFTIEMKHGDTIVLKDIIDNGHLTLTSDTGDHYDPSYEKTIGSGDKTNINTNTGEISDEIVISDVATIDITHTIRTVPVTGMGDSDFGMNPFFIAAAIVAVLGGTGTGYMVKRKKETEA